MVPIIDRSQFNSRLISSNPWGFCKILGFNDDTFDEKSYTMNNKLIYSFNFIRYGSPSRKSEPNLDFEINDLAFFRPKNHMVHIKKSLRKICKIAQAVWRLFRCVNKCLFTCLCLYCFSWESYRSPLCFCFSTRLTSEEKGNESRESISFELGAPHYDLLMIIFQLLEKNCIE